MSRSRRNVVWSFFDLSEAKDRVKCNLCHKVFVYKGGTSNLLKHPDRKHHTDFAAKTAGQGEEGPPYYEAIDLECSAYHGQMLSGAFSYDLEADC